MNRYLLDLIDTLVFLIVVVWFNPHKEFRVAVYPTLGHRFLRWTIKFVCLDFASLLGWNTQDETSSMLKINEEMVIDTRWQVRTVRPWCQRSYKQLPGLSLQGAYHESWIEQFRLVDWWLWSRIEDLPQVEVLMCLVWLAPVIIKEAFDGEWKCINLQYLVQPLFPSLLSLENQSLQLYWVLGRWQRV